MSSTRDGLLSALKHLTALELLPEEQRRLAAEAADKLAGEVVYAAVIGEFKRGKSSLINALLDDEVLPTGVTPVTAAPTLIRAGDVVRVRVLLLDGAELAIPVDELPEYITEQGNPGNRRRVREVVVEHPSPLLRPGMVLADTPGTGSVHGHNSEMTSAFLPRVDVALLVLTVDAPLSGAEAELLAQAGRTVARAAVCLNKIDLLSPAELQEALEFVRTRVTALAEGASVPVFPVSARSAGSGGEGGLTPVRRYLTEIATLERDAVVGERARRVAEGVLQLADTTIRLERAAAARPAEQARAAREAFTEARAELETEAGEAVTLLLATCRRTQDQVVERRVDELRGSLPPVLQAAPEQGWPDHCRAASASWIAAVQGELSTAIAAALIRHGDRLQERLERFVGRAGEAYGVALPPPPDLRKELAIPAIRIETTDEPGALAMGVRQVRRHLPGGPGRRWREAARRDQAMETADRLAGRLRYAALQAIDRAARSWVRDVEGGWRSLSDSLAGAVSRAELAAGSGAESQALSEASLLLDSVRRLLGETPSPIAPPPLEATLPGER